MEKDKNKLIRKLMIKADKQISSGMGICTMICNRFEYKRELRDRAEIYRGTMIQLLRMINRTDGDARIEVLLRINNIYKKVIELCKEIDGIYHPNDDASKTMSI
ncbi:MAG: hypothetical protein LBP63_05530 [Prevotellaceae bacterium]|jgi:hypothetical protein|nr:hypothetical protein [Prevotellaceae bacterium]